MCYPLLIQTFKEECVLVLFVCLDRQKKTSERVRRRNKCLPERIQIYLQNQPDVWYHPVSFFWWMYLLRLPLQLAHMESNPSTWPPPKSPRILPHSLPTANISGMGAWVRFTMAGMAVWSWGSLRGTRSSLPDPLGEPAGSPPWPAKKHYQWDRRGYNASYNAKV